MTNEFNLYFETPKTFEIQNIKPLYGLVGLYFIFTPEYDIQYPFKKSKLLYIGMSEKKTNSIGSRLTGHFEGVINTKVRLCACIYKRDWSCSKYNKLENISRDAEEENSLLS